MSDCGSRNEFAYLNNPTFQRESDVVPVQLIVRRVQSTSGSQLALFATYGHHAFITDGVGRYTRGESAGSALRYL